jgi:hypothetical protein
MMEQLPRRAVAERDEPSWFARRGIILWVLMMFGGISTAAILPLLDLVSANSRPGPLAGFRLVSRPLVILIMGTVAVLIVELVASNILAWRRGATCDARRRMSFGQPRWWQARYPKSLRATDNVWNQMPFAVRLARTIVWLAVVSIPAVVQFIFIVPPLADLVDGMKVPLPLPTRIAIAASRDALKALGAGLPIAAVLVSWSALRSRVPVFDVVRLLFSWRRNDWDSPSGRRLRAS